MATFKVITTIQWKMPIWHSVFGGFICHALFTNSVLSSASAVVSWMKNACEPASDLVLLAGIFPWENMIESVWRMMRTACWLHCYII